MKHDLKNFAFAEGLPAASRTAAAYNSASIDHKDGPCGVFVANVGTYAGGFAAKLQYSDDDSTWVDEPDTQLSNDTEKSLTSAGQVEIFVPNPRGRYSRVVCTLVGTCVFSVTSAIGPLRYIAP